LLLLAEETAKSVRVVLTGLGGDELFGGYPHHHNIPLLLRRQAHWSGWQKALGGLSVGLEPHYPAFKRYRGLGALPSMLPPLRWVGLPRDEALRRAFSFDGMVLTDSLRERLYRPALQQHLAVKDAVYSAIIGDSWRTDPHQTAQALVINTWLHGNALLHTDKVTMAYSLEARVPLFDPALLDFAAGLDPQLWSRANKIVLREAMRPHLPAFALARPKQPFSTPIRGWFAHELREPIGDMLLNPSARVYDLFEKDALRRVVQDHFSGAAKHEELIFRLLTLEAWLTRFGVAAG
jgi:asparagine synthase (glutamine-hydrolysing)